MKLKDWQRHTMKEIKQILEAYQQLDFAQHKAALATVVRVEGSSYRRTGARMLVSDSGEWVGGISGGCLEGDALKRARLAMEKNKAALVTYDTTDDDPYQIGVGLGCNGIIDVLLTPLNPHNAENPVLILKDCPEQRKPNVIITITGLKGSVPLLQLGMAFRYDDDEYFREVFPASDMQEQVLADLKVALQNDKSVSQTYTLPTGEATIFIEVLPPAVHLALFGGSYDVYPMVRLAKEVGWKVSVFCNTQKVHKSLFELADHVLPKEADLNVDAYTAAILMAHDYETDYKNLRRLLATPVTYIGMLGPRKRTEKMIVRANDEGKPFAENEISRMISPVGLDTGAATPEEIAVSAIAEIRTHFSGRSGGRLRMRGKPIYES